MNRKKIMQRKKEKTTAHFMQMGKKACCVFLSASRKIDDIAAKFDEIKQHQAHRFLSNKIPLKQPIDSKNKQDRSKKNDWLIEIIKKNDGQSDWNFRWVYIRKSDKWNWDIHPTTIQLYYMCICEYNNAACLLLLEDTTVNSIDGNSAACSLTLSLTYIRTRSISLTTMFRDVVKFSISFFFSSSSLYGDPKCNLFVLLIYVDSHNKRCFIDDIQSHWRKSMITLFRNQFKS